MTGTLTQHTPHLATFQGHLQVGALLDGARAFLFEFGDGAVCAALAARGVTAIDGVAVTHHHRDQLCGLPGMLPDAPLYAPAAERGWIEAAAAHWTDPASRWHLYNYRHHRLMLTQSVPVARALADGETFTWGPARITALATPGHTAGSLSYLVEVDGRRIAFCGDLLAGPGQLWDLYSLQKGLTTTDYHGFLGAREELLAGLQRLEEAAPELIVPAHGPVITDPTAAIALAQERLAACYDLYGEISALRWYFPAMFPGYLEGSAAMPIGKGAPPPVCLRQIGTSWVLISETGAAFVMDCGASEVVDVLRGWLTAGEIRAVDGLWITHYHDDHVDGVQTFLEAFPCPVHADASVAEVISDPLAWRLPCISPVRVPVEHVTADGESWRWHEFTFTAYHLPGQTLHHGGLQVDGPAGRLFFTGDSFTPAGIDDYCMQNRLFQGAGRGFDACLALLEQVQPDLCFNAHVEVAFRFTAEELGRMRRNLAARVTAFGALTPWEDVNFAMDDGWAYCHPFEQAACPGERVAVTVVVTNHGTEEVLCGAQLVLPRGWGETAPASLAIPAGAVGRLMLECRLSADVAPGRYVLPVDLTFGERSLPQWCEAVVGVAAK